MRPVAVRRTIKTTISAIKEAGGWEQFCKDNPDYSQIADPSSTIFITLTQAIQYGVLGSIKSKRQERIEKFNRYAARLKKYYGVYLESVTSESLYFTTRKGRKLRLSMHIGNYVGLQIII